MLCGIIVNNGIVLVDYINKLRIDGKERIESIVEAGKTRMRPILITALTTVLGLVVMGSWMPEMICGIACTMVVMICGRA